MTEEQILDDKELWKVGDASPIAVRKTCRTKRTRSALTCFH